jgi:hypothetical protein
MAKPFETNLKKPDGNLRFEVSIDTGAWAEAWKKFPFEAGKRANKFVNNQAFYFRDQVFKVIKSGGGVMRGYVIRNGNYSAGIFEKETKSGNLS